MNHSNRFALALGLVVTIGGCGEAPPAEEESSSTAGADQQVGSTSQALWKSCNPIHADIFDHVDAGRAHDCGFLEYCATGSEQVIGNFFTLEWKTLSETNPGYWVLGNCLPTTSFIWPVAGSIGAPWVVQGYSDLDPTIGVKRDYLGGMKNYDGHAGVDIAVANFRQQDAGVNVLAAATGTVIAFDDTADDRSIDINTCVSTGRQNFIRLRHANGSEATYYHIRRNSVNARRIRVGQTVTQGTVIAQVGSSGCTSNPHLHFEVREFGTDTTWDGKPEFNGPLLDPFRESMFAAGNPPYKSPLVVLDTALIAGNVTGDRRRLLEPGTNATSVNRLQPMTIVMYVGNGYMLERYWIRVIAPSGSELWRSPEVVLDDNHTYNFVPWAVTTGTPGVHRVEFMVGTQVRTTRTYTVL